MFLHLPCGILSSSVVSEICMPWGFRSSFTFPVRSRSSSVLLCVHRDHEDYQGRAQDGHLDVHTASEFRFSRPSHSSPLYLSSLVPFFPLRALYARLVFIGYFFVDSIGIYNTCLVGSIGLYSLLALWIPLVSIGHLPCGFHWSL